jgi:hypothetical protein
MLEAMSADLGPALRTAGFALAHAAGSIQLGGTLCTLAIVVAEEQHTLFRYEAPTIPDSVASAHEHLAGQIGDGAHGALVYDGFVTPTGEGRSDALVVEILGPGAALQGRLVQAYRPARRLGLPIVGRRFAGVGPPIIDESIEDGGAEAMVYDGARDHPFGARLFGLPRT